MDAPFQATTPTILEQDASPAYLHFFSISSRLLSLAPWQFWWSWQSQSFNTMDIKRRVVKSMKFVFGENRIAAVASDAGVNCHVDSCSWTFRWWTTTRRMNGWKGFSFTKTNSMKKLIQFAQSPLPPSATKKSPTTSKTSKTSSISTMRQSMRKAPFRVTTPDIIPKAFCYTSFRPSSSSKSS